MNSAYEWGPLLKTSKSRMASCGSLWDKGHKRTLKKSSSFAWMPWWSTSGYCELNLVSLDTRNLSKSIISSVVCSLDYGDHCGNLQKERQYIHCVQRFQKLETWCPNLLPFGLRKSSWEAATRLIMEATEKRGCTARQEAGRRADWGGDGSFAAPV